MKVSPKERSLLRTVSSDSVSVTWLDRPAARESAREAALKLAARHSEITGILLFGSILRGDAVPGSDVDLLVVLSEARKPFLERIPDYEVVVDGIAVDVFPYTSAELERMLGAKNSLICEAFREGEWVIGGTESS